MLRRRRGRCGWTFVCVCICVHRCSREKPLTLTIAPIITHHTTPSIGGLWAELPAWQTLQNDTGDFCLNVRQPPTS